MNLADMTSHIGLRTGRGANDKAILSFVNEALSLYSNADDWPWLRSQEAMTAPADGIQTWSLPYLTRKVREVRVNGSELPDLADSDLAQYGYFNDGAALTFYPDVAAGHQVTITTYRTEPPLTDLFASPLIPDMYIWPIIDLASALMLERVDTKWSLEQARLLRERYDDWLKAQRKAKSKSSTNRMKMRGDHPAQPSAAAARFFR